MNYVFKTPCHPQALGQKVHNGESYSMLIPTDEKGELTILMGRKQIVGMVAMALRMMQADPELAREARKVAKNIKRE